MGNLIDYLVYSPYKKTGRKDEVRYCCPECGDYKYHLYVNLTKGLYHCFRCNYSGKLSERDLKRLVYGFDIDLDVKDGEQQEEQQKKNVISKRKESRIDLESDSFISKLAVRYLKKRGFGSDLKRYGVYVDDNLRLVFPGYDIDGKEMFYMYRSLVSGDYRLSKGGKGIYNIYNIIKFNVRDIFITEGIFDALSFGDNGVALLGKFISEFQREQLLSLRDKIDRIFIVLDNDAFSDAFKLYNSLQPWFKVFIKKIPKEYKDANEFYVDDRERFMEFKEKCLKEV